MRVLVVIVVTWKSKASSQFNWYWTADWNWAWQYFIIANLEITSEGQKSLLKPLVKMNQISSKFSFLETLNLIKPQQSGRGRGQGAIFAQQKSFLCNRLFNWTQTRLLSQVCPLWSGLRPLVYLEKCMNFDHQRTLQDPFFYQGSSNNISIHLGSLYCIQELLIDRISIWVQISIQFSIGNLIIFFQIGCRSHSQTEIQKNDLRSDLVLRWGSK